MSKEAMKTNEDDTPRTGTSVEWRGGETPGRPAPEEEEDVRRAAHLAEARSAGQKEGTKTEPEESNPPRD